MKQHLTQSYNHKVTVNKRAVSTIISTVILTSVLLVILLTASFVSLNILSSQMASTEFDQAKSNMLLLDTTIQDVSLRPGAGGYVQFNERTGGIGLKNQTADSLSITATDGIATYTLNFSGLVQFIYRGGSLASGAVDQNIGFTSLRGLNNSYVNTSQGLSFLRLEQDDGVKIKLDYNRVRIVSAGLIDAQTNLVQINFIRLANGPTSGSGIVNVQVQNVKTNTTQWQFPSGVINITTASTQNGIQNYSINQTLAGANQTVVIFSEVQVLASIT